MTVSTIYMTPKAHDQGATITCRAENGEIHNSALEDHWRLKVHHKPIVSLKFGASLDPTNIAEDNDVYFECRVISNPKAYKIVWLHNDIMVTHDKSRGVLIAGSSLVLQRVNRRMSGSYSCVASNVEGDTASNVIELKVKHKPMCANFGGKVIQGIGRGKKSSILCPVLAHPRPTKFSWTFNNSVEAKVVSKRYDFYSANVRNLGPG